jgi:hypothetical protein
MSSSKNHKELKELLDKSITRPDIDPEDIDAIYEDIPLSYKERIVVEELCRHGSQTKAGVAVGMKESAASAGVNSYLKKANVQLAILRRQQALAKAATISKEWITVELINMYEDLKGRKVPDMEIQLRILNQVAKLNGYYNEFNFNMDENIDSIEIKIIKPNRTIDTEYEDTED